MQMLVYGLIFRIMLKRLFVVLVSVFTVQFVGAQSFDYTATSGDLGTTYSWIDCSSGTEILDADWLQDKGLGDKKDDGYAEISWPFNFQFYDSYYFSGEKMYFCTNGFIRFDGIPNDDASNTYKNSIDSYSPNLGELVAFAMEDAGLENNNSTVHYLTTGSGSNRIFTIEVQNLEIRFNQGKYIDVQISFYETSNKIVIMVGSFDVSSSFSTYLGIHSGNSSYKDQWGELQDIGENKWKAYTPPAKAYSAITVTQASTHYVYHSDNNEILRVQFDITGGSGAFNLTDLDITNQSTDYSDIGNVKLFHTTESTFSADHQVGAAVTYSGGKYTFSGLGYDMPGGTSYIWVTYDILETATSGHDVDGYIAANDITLNGVNYPSSTANPTGVRNINFSEWKGSTSTNWNTASNWTGNTVPTSGDNVIIPSAPGNQPHILNANSGASLDVLIETGASLTCENGGTLNVTGSLFNKGSIVSGNTNINLQGSNNVLKGTGTWNTARFELNNPSKYTLKNSISCALFEIDNNSTLVVGEYSLVCSGIINSKSGSTLSTTSGSIEAAGTVTLAGTYTPGTGLFYYSGNNSQSIVNKTYFNLKVKLSPGTRTLTNVSTNCKSLEIVGSGTAALASSININDNYIIEAGCTVDMNGESITLEGDWTNNGTLIPGSQTVTFDGKGSSHIYGNSDFYNLTINKSTGDVYSNGSNHITNILALTKGVIHSNSGTSIILDAGAGYTGGTDVSSFVYGPMRKDGNTNFKFPIGGFRKFAPCELTNLTATTHFVAEYKKSGSEHSASLIAPLTKVSTKEYWKITPSSAVNADVKLYWLDGSWSGIGDLGDLRLAHYNGTKWEELSGATTTGDVNSGTIIKLGVSSFSPFTYGTTDNTTNPLPVSLISFDVKKVDNTALLEWQTASEINNDYFVIQRSVDGIEVEDMGIIDGNGNSNTLLSYSFIDENPPYGNVYYRLKQVDYDGKYEIFNWKNLFFGHEIEISIYPNPNTNNMIFFESSVNNNALVQIYTIDGKLIMENDIVFTSGNASLNHNLSKGYYIIHYLQNNEQTIQKLIIQ